MTPASGRLATDFYEPAPQIGPGQRKSSIRTTGAHASGCRLLARLSAVSHCSRLAVLFDASAKTVPATLNLPCSGQSNPSAPVLSRAAASDRQIGHVVIGQPTSRRVVNGTATCASKRIASVAQLVRRDHTFSTGRDRRSRRAGRCSPAMVPVARVVRAGGHVAERRDHFLLADNAGVAECRIVSLAVCTEWLLCLLRCHGRRRKKQCDGQREYFHKGLHSPVARAADRR
jgi:hypothetical protein